jgi:ABC-2 type transport system ATP-binding protein
MNNAIEIQTLCKSYKDFPLNNISFSLPMGYIMGFVGHKMGLVRPPQSA